MSEARRLAWIADGSPFQLMRPARDLRDVLRRYGYTVYALGDKRHLEHEPPEDHTPYSATGYPGTAQYGVGYAVDIMPPPAGSGLPSLQRLGAQLLADRKSGVAGIKWLKYMNWEPEADWSGPCYQERWMPTYARRSSSDRGHIHLSGLTGFETSMVGAGYDPVARIRGVSDDMSAEAERRIESLFNAVFYGGSSMGRTVDPDGAGTRQPGNSLVAKLDWLLGQADAQRLRDEAVLAAVRDRSETTEILSRIDQRAAELRQEAAQRAEAEAQRDAELRALVEQAQDGTLDADEVLRRMGELLAAAPQQS